MHLVDAAVKYLNVEPADGYAERTICMSDPKTMQYVRRGFCPRRGGGGEGEGESKVHELNHSISRPRDALCTFFALRCPELKGDTTVWGAWTDSQLRFD